MIFTSYFSSKLIRGRETQCVGVSRKHVKNFKYCTKLEPPKAMFDAYRKAKETGDAKIIKKALKRYEIQYKNYLLTLDVHAAYQALNGKILLCFEKDDKTCHRKWIRDWFRHFGYRIAELTAGDRDNVYEQVTIDIGTLESSTTTEKATTEKATTKKATTKKANQVPETKDFAVAVVHEFFAETMWQEFFVKPFGGVFSQY